MRVELARWSSGYWVLLSFEIVGKSLDATYLPKYSPVYIYL